MSRIRIVDATLPVNSDCLCPENISFRKGTATYGSHEWRPYGTVLKNVVVGYAEFEGKSAPIRKNIFSYECIYCLKERTVFREPR